MRILLIDDDVVLCQLIAEYFDLHDVSVTMRHSGEEGLREANLGIYDAIILDIMLPNIGGLSVLKKLIETTNIPVLMLTANGCDMDHILGLEMGADDFINKPCKPKVLLARIEAVLKRRNSVKNSEAHQPMTFQNLTLNTQNRQAVLGGSDLILTVTEYDILLALIRKANAVISKNELALLTLGRKLTRYDRSLDMHISNLRQKINSVKTAGVMIKTIHGFGYALEKSDEA